MSDFAVTEGKEGCTFRVHVVPRSRRNGVAGLYGEALKVWLKAPPVEGKANQTLIKFLADQLTVPAGAVEILSGHSTRRKIIRVTGVGAAQVQALLGNKK